MITKEKYINKMLEKFNEYEVKCNADLSLLEKNAEVIKQLQDAFIIKDIMTAYKIKEKYAGFMCGEAYAFEYCDKIVNINNCVEFLQGNKNNMKDILSSQYDTLEKQFARLYENKGKGKYKTHAYDSFNYIFKAKTKVIEFAKFMDIDLSLNDLTDWIGHEFEVKNLKFKIYKNNNIDIIVL